MVTVATLRLNSTKSQPLDVGCFAPLKRAYGRFVSDLARASYNHIDKLDFLTEYPQARIEAFKPQTIQTSSLLLVLHRLTQSVCYRS